MFKKKTYTFAKSIGDEEPEDPEDPEDPQDPDEEPIDPDGGSGTTGGWGIADGYYLWPTVIKILLVIDGRIVLNRSKTEFGLGYALDSLTERFAWWVSLEIDIAKRAYSDPEPPDSAYPVKFQQFKFTDPGFDLNAYDQLWLFGDLPNADDGADGANTDADIATFGLSDEEVKLLAEWMDRGGGVFATGDHTLLGASLSSRIPRVRTMRKWRDADGVPARDNANRNQTYQPHIDPSDPETDIFMQPVELVYFPAQASSPFSNGKMPHPLLCSTHGPIDFFPDHMHEGELFYDNEVNLNRALDIPNYDRPEYPSRVGPAGETIRPRPMIVAYGQTTHNDVVVDPTTSIIGGGGITVGRKRFGLVGAYDGDSINIGRVVVDSTWHHWLSLNLRAQLLSYSVVTTEYRKMQDYFRNVALWLARPAQRQAMVASASWGIITGSAPMEFIPGNNPWDIGERVLRVFSQTASPCLRKQLTDTVLGDLARSESPQPAHEAEPVWSTLPVVLTTRAVFGGIGSGLIDLALAHRDARAAGQRPPLDADAIRTATIRGVSIVHDLIAKAMGDGARAFNATNVRLQSEQLAAAPDIVISIEVQRMRLVARRLQLPDPSDPALVGDQLVFTIRLNLDGVVVGQRVFEQSELPSFGSHGAVIEFDDVVICEFDVYAGETLQVEVVSGNGEHSDEERKLRRFRDQWRVERPDFPGDRVPSRRQPWRLWYSVQPVTNRSPREEL